MTDTEIPLQYRKNGLLTAALATQESVQWLRSRLTALEGDIDPREFAAAVESLRRVESAVATIRQIGERIGAER
jgi:hypothetical protein